MGALEGLRELAGIAVPHPPGDLLHRDVRGGEQVGGAGHPNSSQIRPKAKAGHIREHALELAWGGRDPPGDVVDPQRAAELRREYVGRLLEDRQVRLLRDPPSDWCFASGHV
jgi:hypothetical protein